MKILNCFYRKSLLNENDEHKSRADYIDVIRYILTVNLLAFKAIHLSLQKINNDLYIKGNRSLIYEVTLIFII